MRISVHVIPNSSIESIIPPKDENQVYRVHLRVKPIESKANKALVNIIAKYFNVAKSCVSIYKGHNSSNKIVDIFSD